MNPFCIDDKIVKFFELCNNGWDIGSIVISSCEQINNTNILKLQFTIWNRDIGSNEYSINYSISVLCCENFTIFSFGLASYLLLHESDMFLMYES